MSAAALFAAGEATGIGYYGAVLVLFAEFAGLVLAYCLRTRYDLTHPRESARLLLQSR